MGIDTEIFNKILKSTIQQQVAILHHDSQSLF